MTGNLGGAKTQSVRLKPGTAGRARVAQPPSAVILFSGGLSLITTTAEGGCATRSWFALFLVMLMAAASWANVIEVPLTYSRYSSQSDQPGFRLWGGRSLDKSTWPPSGDWKLPGLAAKKPVYAVLKLADTERLLIFDQKDKKDFFYNRLYYDANGNKDLTDDPALDDDGNKADDSGYCFSLFPPIDATAPVSGTALPYAFRVEATYSYTAAMRKSKEIDLDRVNLFMMVDCAYKGGFEFEGGRYEVQFGDSDGDGRFNRPGSVRTAGVPPGIAQVLTQGDVMHITSDTGESFLTGFAQPLPQRLVIGKTLFDVQLVVPDMKLTLTPIAEGLAELSLASAPERLTLTTDDGRAFIVAYRPGQSVMLPPGTYRLQNCQMFRQDNQGDRWMLKATATTACHAVTLRAGEEAVLAFGEPYTPVVEVPEYAREAMQHGLQDAVLVFSVAGAGKEVVSELAHVAGEKTGIPLSSKDRKRPKEATYKVLSSEGEIVAQGQFEYG